MFRRDEKWKKEEGARVLGWKNKKLCCLVGVIFDWKRGPKKKKKQRIRNIMDPYPTLKRKVERKLYALIKILNTDKRNY